MPNEATFGYIDYINFSWLLHITLHNDTRLIGEDTFVMVISQIINTSIIRLGWLG